MKKGSRARKCKDCGQVVFWGIPQETILGLQVCSLKIVKEHRYVPERRAYVCMDCLKKARK